MGTAIFLLLLVAAFSAIAISGNADMSLHVANVCFNQS
jgi:hypothetical protein